MTVEQIEQNMMKSEKMEGNEMKEEMTKVEKGSVVKS